MASDKLLLEDIRVGENLSYMGFAHKESGQGKKSLVGEFGFNEQPPLVDQGEIRKLQDRHYRTSMDNLLRGSCRGESPMEVIERFIMGIYYPKLKVVNTRLQVNGEQTILESYFLSQLGNLDFLKGRRRVGSLSVLDSINCLRDRIRTKKFLLGLQEAIGKLKSDNASYINVLDAGCGAIPIMAIYAALCSETVRCTALELNPESAEFARRLIKKLNLQDRIEVIEADAITFKPEGLIDLLISETMNSCLTEEPIVQIMTNLSKYVRNGGIILPGKITIHVVLIPLQKSSIGKVNTGIWDSYDSHEKKWHQALEYNPGEVLEEIVISMPIYNLQLGDYFVVVTSAVTIGSVVLGPVESVLTMPLVVRNELSIPHIFNIGAECPYESIVIEYKPGESLDGKGRFSSRLP